MNLYRAVPKFSIVQEMANILFIVYRTTSLSTVDINWPTIFVKQYDKLKIYFSK